MTSRSTPVEQLIDTYCDAWSEPNPAERRTLLEDVLADHATYTDPTVHTVGLEALLAHIASVLARRPGSSVVRTSPVDVHHDIARFTWHVVEADGTTLPEGIDIVELSADGRLRRIIGFFGPL